jgi:hypothetical protein
MFHATSTALPPPIMTVSKKNIRLPDYFRLSQILQSANGTSNITKSTGDVTNNSTKGYSGLQSTIASATGDVNKTHTKIKGIGDATNKSNTTYSSSMSTNISATDTSVTKHHNSTTESTVTSLSHNEENGSSFFPLITLMTTFQMSSDKITIYHNTLRIWSLLKPEVRTVVFCSPEDQEAINAVKKYGHTVEMVPKTFNNIPVLRSMFIAAKAKYNSTFYGYANGDILFTESLVKTLRTLNMYKDNIIFKQILVVGRRHNHLIENKTLETLEQVQNCSQFAHGFTSDAQDYFITTRDGFPWEDIPDLVVGRPGYDNWLVATAIRQNITVVEATRTLLAIHQTGPDGNYAGGKKNGTRTNHDLVKPFDYSLGRTSCTQLYTAYNGTVVVLKERTKNLCEKIYYKYNLNPYAVKLNETNDSI